MDLGSTFVRNAQQNEARSATVRMRTKDGPEQSLTYNLGDFGAKVLYVPPGASDLTGGEWLPKPVVRPDAAQSAPAAVPVRIASIAAEEPADDWRDVPPGKHLEFARNLRPKIRLLSREIQSVRERSGIPAGAVHTLGRGRRLPDSAHQRNQTLCSKDGYFDLGKLVNEGSNTAEILFENLGCPNFGPVIEQRQGITHLSLVPQQARAHAVEGWRMKVVTGRPRGIAGNSWGFRRSRLADRRSSGSRRQHARRNEGRLSHDIADFKTVARGRSCDDFRND